MRRGRPPASRSKILESNTFTILDRSRIVMIRCSLNRFSPAWPPRARAKDKSRSADVFRAQL
jgi:hypothetical protein